MKCLRFFIIIKMNPKPIPASANTFGLSLLVFFFIAKLKIVCGVENGLIESVLKCNLAPQGFSNDEGAGIP